jgi:hypothetical protein
VYFIVLAAPVGHPGFYDFCVKGPEAFLPVVYAWVVFLPSCFTMGWGASGLSFCVVFEKGYVYGFPTFYSFDTVPLNLIRIARKKCVAVRLGVI